MGNVVGTVWRYDRDDLGMTPVEWEMVTRLVEAYPAPVPYDRCVHLSNGEWGGGDRAGGVDSDVRLRLGPSAIETVVRRGYRAGPLLVDLIRGLGESPGASEVNNRLRVDRPRGRRPRPLLRSVRASDDEAVGSPRGGPPSRTGTTGRG